MYMYQIYTHITVVQPCHYVYIHYYYLALKQSLYLITIVGIHPSFEDFTVGNRVSGWNRCSQSSSAAAEQAITSMPAAWT